MHSLIRQSFRRSAWTRRKCVREVIIFFSQVNNFAPTSSHFQSDFWAKSEESKKHTSGNRSHPSRNFNNSSVSFCQLIHRIEPDSAKSEWTILQSKGRSGALEIFRTRNTTDKGNHKLKYVMPRATSLRYCDLVALVPLDPKTSSIESFFLQMWYKANTESG